MSRAALLASALAASSAALPPPMGTVVSFEPHALSSVALRHCDYVASFTPDDGSDDFRFKVVPALNGAPSPGASLQSINYPNMHFGPTGKGLALGISASLDADDASFTILAGHPNASFTSLRSLS